MMLYFAYGSNMDRAVMRKHAPTAEVVGVGSLANRRFAITTDGYATLQPARASTVHGVLWRITPRDRVILDLWENMGTGLYRIETLRVRQSDRSSRALVYLARPRPLGWPNAGYLELIIAAARQWELPARYLASLQSWLPARPMRGGGRKYEEFAGANCESIPLVPQCGPGEGEEHGVRLDEIGIERLYRRAPTSGPHNNDYYSPGPDPRQSAGGRISRLDRGNGEPTRRPRLGAQLRRRVG